MNFEEILTLFRDGNERFARGEAIGPNRDPKVRIHTSQTDQNPLAAVVACSDSRKSVEILLDIGLGDIFVVRQAGNVIATNEAGSLEFAFETFNTPLCIVMGHTICGAISAVINKIDMPENTIKLTLPICRTVDRTVKAHPELKGDALIDKATCDNVWDSIENLFKISPITRKRVRNKQLKIIGAIYDLKTGRVDWKGEHPQQAVLIQ